VDRKKVSKKAETWALEVFKTTQQVIGRKNLAI
jgi:hypothetical protein